MQSWLRQSGRVDRACGKYRCRQVRLGRKRKKHAHLCRHTRAKVFESNFAGSKYSTPICLPSKVRFSTTSLAAFAASELSNLTKACKNPTPDRGISMPSTWIHQFRHHRLSSHHNGRMHELAAGRAKFSRLSNDCFEGRFFWPASSHNVGLQNEYA